MKGKLFWIVVPLTALLLLFALAISSGFKSEPSRPSGGEKATGEVMAIPAPACAGPRVNNEECPPIRRGEEVTLEEARQRVKFDFPTPAYLPQGASLQKVYTSPLEWPPESRAVAFLYSNKMVITILRWESWGLTAPPSPERSIALRPDIYFPITVRGRPGYAVEPRSPAQECTTVEYAPGQTRTECWTFPSNAPGYIEWVVGELLIHVESYEPVAEMLKVAESMDFGQPPQ